MLATPQDALAVPPADPAALAERIRKLLSDRGLVTRLAAAARNTAIARFDKLRLIDSIIGIYDDLHKLH